MTREKVKERGKQMKNFKFLLTIALSTTLLCGCVKNDPNALVLVNGEPITKAEYEQAFDGFVQQSMFAKMGMDVKKEPESYIALSIKDRVINELIVKNLLEQDVKKQKIKATKEDLDAQMKKIIDQVGSKDKFNEILDQNGISPIQFKKDLTEEVKITKLIESLPVKAVTDKDIEKYYKANIEKFKYPTRVKASHILISANKEEIKEVIKSDSANADLTQAQVDKKVKEELVKQEAKAKKLLVEVKKDKKQFAKIAKENSDDPVSAKDGGDLGFFGKDQMVAEFSKVAFSLKPGTLSGVVKSPYGYHIILVTDKQEAGTEKLSVVKEDIKNYLSNQARIEVLQKHIEQLKSQAKIVYNDQSFDPAILQKKIKEEGVKYEAAQKEAEKAAKAAKGAKGAKGVKPAKPAIPTTPVKK